MRSFQSGNYRLVLGMLKRWGSVVAPVENCCWLVLFIKMGYCSNIILRLEIRIRVDAEGFEHFNVCEKKTVRGGF